MPEPTAVSEAPAVGTQEAVNAATSFDSAAATLFDDAPVVESPSTTEEQTQGTSEQVPSGTETKPAPDVTDEWAVPTSIAELAKAAPDLQKFIEQYQKLTGYREHWPTLEEAQQAKALVPGGLAELKEHVEIARSAREENAAFASGDPTKQLPVLEGLASEMPEQFAAAMPVYMGIVAKQNPEAYQAFVKGELTKSLEAEGLTTVSKALVDKLLDAAQREDEKGFGEAFSELAKGVKPQATAKTAEKAKDPEVAKLEARLKEYEEKDKKAVAENFGNWWKPTQEEVVKQIRADVTGRIDGMLPKNVPSAFREHSLGLILRDIDAKISAALQSDVGHSEKLGALLANGAWQKTSDATRSQYVNLTVGRAKQLIPHIVAEVMKPYTEAAVANAATKNEKEGVASKRVDIEGAGATAKVRQLTKKDVAGMTDEQILDM